MEQLVMDDKEMFLRNWDDEQKITLKVLRAYPAGKDDLRPAEKSRTAKELAGVFVEEQMGIIDGVIKGHIDWAHFMDLVPKTNSVRDVITRLETDYARLSKAVRAMSEAEWNEEMDWPVAPRQMGKMRRGDALRYTIRDMIHHRGQFSIYLRIAGGKLPSIYGPSADEPWM